MTSALPDQVACMMCTAKVGIAITTFNRANLLKKLLSELKRLTSQEHVIVVCDDGSSDETVEVARAAGVVVIAGENRGIAWNKNRGIYYLVNYTQVETIILLDDDVVPIVFGWEREWSAAVAAFGHVNHVLGSMWESTKGPKTASATFPSFNTQLSGQCLAFSRPCLAEVGYMDTRFRRYGHEHTDLTLRAICRGYGGLAGAQVYFLVINGGVTVLDGVPTHGTEEQAEENRRVFEAMRLEPPYRPPWRDEEEYGLLMQEMRTAAPVVRFTGAAAERYMIYYPDIEGEGVDAAIHWIHFGRDEGRSWE